MKVKDLRNLLNSMDSEYDEADVITSISDEDIEVIKKDCSQRYMHLEDFELNLYHRKTNRLYIHELTTYEEERGYTHKDLCPDNTGALVLTLHTFGVCSSID